MQDCNLRNIKWLYVYVAVSADPQCYATKSINSEPNQTTSQQFKKVFHYLL